MKLLGKSIDYSTVEAVKKTASEHNLHVNTIWKWVKAYRENKSILASVPKNVVGQQKKQGCRLN